MTSGRGLFVAALGGLAVATAAIAQQQPERPKQNSQPPAGAKGDSTQGPGVYDLQSLTVSREANTISRAANRIASEQARYSFWQVVLGGFGALFAAIAAGAAIAAAIYARQAAQAAAISATADNEALAETRAAGVEARKEAVQQAKRASEQLQLLDDTMQYTAQGARAMESSAQQTRSVAAAMQTSAEAAQRQAELTERAMTVMERPYVFFHTTEKLAAGPGLAKLPPNAFRVVWKNFGKTPALVSRVRLGISREDDGSDPSTMPKQEMPFGAIIGVDDGWPRGQVVITDEMIKEFQDDARPIWLCGEITYRGLHGKEHRSWFCRFYVGAGFLLDDGCDPAFNGYE